MILVAGASGVVGRALMTALIERGTGPLRAFVRTELDAVRLRDRGIEAAVGDLVDGRGVDGAMRGVRTLVYLVHTLDRRGDLVANDLAAARNAALAARAAGVQRLIFLGHVAASDEARSRYLLGRWAVERAMQQSGLRTTILRAPLIVAPEAQPFGLMHWMADRSPVVPAFGWRKTPIEPVALADVIEALTMAIEDEAFDGRSFDVCGAERLTAGEMVRVWNRAVERRRLTLPLPQRIGDPTAWLAWASRQARLRRSRALLETLREPQLCLDPSRRFPLPHRPASYHATIEALVAES